MRVLLQSRQGRAWSACSSDVGLGPGSRLGCCFVSRDTSVAGLRVRPEPDQRGRARGGGAHGSAAAAHRHLGEGQAAAAAADWAAAGHGRAGARPRPGCLAPVPGSGPASLHSSTVGRPPSLGKDAPLQGGLSSPRWMPLVGTTLSFHHLAALLSAHQDAGPLGVLSTLEDTDCGLI